MDLLEEAVLRFGVINMLPGDGIEVFEVALTDPNLAASTSPDPRQPSSTCGGRVGDNIHRYRSHPRNVGEAGGEFHQSRTPQLTFKRATHGREPSHPHRTIACRWQAGQSFGFDLDDGS